MYAFELLDNDELLLISRNLMKEYNRIREALRNKVEGYFRQSIAAKYYKESDIIELTNECLSIKQRYLMVRDVLVDRGVRVSTFSPRTPRTTNDDLFATV